MASKNVLKTMAAIALGRVMADKMNISEDVIFDTAWDAWKFHPDQDDMKTILKWLNRFEVEIWQGSEQDARTNISFALAILERQAGFLRGAKLNAVNGVVDLLQGVYEGLELPDNDEYNCIVEAEKAFQVWDRIVSQ